jgi:tetratricopeptide (TPR) repeat protein
MKLSGVEYQKLVKSIVKAYPTKDDLAQIVMYSLEENIDTIVNSETTTQSIVFNLINWAETRGKLKNLLEILSQERPDNVELQNTIKNLLTKYSQNNENITLDNQSERKNNNLSLVLKNCFLGIGIIIISFMGYNIFVEPKVPKLLCDNKLLQEKSDSIKIIIADFEGNPDPNLKTSLKEILKGQIPSDVTICKFNQKVKESSEANQLGKRLFPKHPNSVLVIWGRSSQFSFSGGIESIDNNFDDIQLDIPLDEKDKSKFKNTYLKTLDLQINYGIASLYYFQANEDNTWKSERLLKMKLNNIINCKINNEILTIKPDQTIDLNLKQIKQIAAESYSLLGASHQENNNYEDAIKSYKCSYKFEENFNRRDTLLLQQAENYMKQSGNYVKQSENYVKIEKINKALEIYQNVINNDSSDSISRALVSRSQMFVYLNKCPQAERDLGQVIDKNLDRPYGLDVRSRIRLFNCPNRLGAIADLFEFSKIDPQDSQNRIDHYSQILRDRADYHQIVSELQEIQKTHPEWQKLINQLIQQDISQ